MARSRTHILALGVATLVLFVGLAAARSTLPAEDDLTVKAASDIPLDDDILETKDGLAMEKPHAESGEATDRAPLDDQQETDEATLEDQENTGATGKRGSRSKKQVSTICVQVAPVTGGQPYEVCGDRAQRMLNDQLQQQQLQQQQLQYMSNGYYGQPHFSSYASNPSLRQDSVVINAPAPRPDSVVVTQPQSVGTYTTVLANGASPNERSAEDSQGAATLASAPLPGQSNDPIQAAQTRQAQQDAIDQQQAKLQGLLDQQAAQQAASNGPPQPRYGDSEVIVQSQPFGRGGVVVQQPGRSEVIVANNGYNPPSTVIIDQQRGYDPYGNQYGHFRQAAPEIAPGSAPSGPSAPAAPAAPSAATAPGSENARTDTGLAVPITPASKQEDPLVGVPGPVNYNQNVQQPKLIYRKEIIINKPQKDKGKQGLGGGLLSVLPQILQPIPHPAPLPIQAPYPPPLPHPPVVYPPPLPHPPAISAPVLPHPVAIPMVLNCDLNSLGARPGLSYPVHGGVGGSGGYGGYGGVGNGFGGLGGLPGVPGLPLRQDGAAAAADAANAANAAAEASASAIAQAEQQSARAAEDDEMKKAADDLEALIKNASQTRTVTVNLEKKEPAQPIIPAAPLAPSPNQLSDDNIRKILAEMEANKREMDMIQEELKQLRQQAAMRAGQASGQSAGQAAGQASGQSAGQAAGQAGGQAASAPVTPKAADIAPASSPGHIDETQVADALKKTADMIQAARAANEQEAFRQSVQRQATQQQATPQLNIQAGNMPQTMTGQELHEQMRAASGMDGGEARYAGMMDPIGTMGAPTVIVNLRPNSMPINALPGPTIVRQQQYIPMQSHGFYRSNDQGLANNPGYATLRQSTIETPAPAATFSSAPAPAPEAPSAPAAPTDPFTARAGESQPENQQGLLQKIRDAQNELVRMRSALGKGEEELGVAAAKAASGGSSASIGIQTQNQSQGGYDAYQAQLTGQGSRGTTDQRGASPAVAPGIVNASMAAASGPQVYSAPPSPSAISSPASFAPNSRAAERYWR